MAELDFGLKDTIKAHFLIFEKKIMNSQNKLVIFIISNKPVSFKVYVI